jgi:chemotaxis family two-component system response regulator Rcp1
MNPTAQRPFHILLVEDSPADVLLTREALSDSKLLVELHVAENGRDAMNFLRRTGSYLGVPTPDLVLLDLNLPLKDGREVLSEVKADPELRSIPVVVLTTSQAEEDVLRAYGLHANCYITKPVDFESFVNVVRSIQQFWFSIVTLPRHAK